MSIFSTRAGSRSTGPGQESVSDCPHPPHLRPTDRVGCGSCSVVTSSLRRHTRSRVLERATLPTTTSRPTEAFASGAVERCKGTSFCEWKGHAAYFTVHGGGRVVTEGAWGYDEPSEPFAPIHGHVAFYASRMDACYVDDELVVAQPGGFYGGWITSDVAGPFKGGPGTRGW